MTLLLDQGLPRSALRALRAARFDAVHVGELGLAKATDTAILREAERRQAVIITMDADFHALLAVSGATTPSVIRIRIEGLGGEALARLILDVISTAKVNLEAGAAVSVNQRKVRVRRLPITG